jgi:hypothetical protein
MSDHLHDEPENTTSGETGWAVYRDGTQRSPSGMTYGEAFAWLLRAQGQSVHHATTHEGWELREQPYCQPHDIYDCPFAHG